MTLSSWSVPTHTADSPGGHMCSTLWFYFLLLCAQVILTSDGFCDWLLDPSLPDAIGYFTPTVDPA